MRAPLTYSILFHLTVFVLAVYGVPWPQPDVIATSQIIEVEVVEVSETPEPQPPVPEAKPDPPPPPPPRPQPPQVAALQPPAPAPEPEPEPEPAPAPPKPEAKPEPEPEPPKPKPKRKKPVVKLPKPPRAKPKPPPKDDFTSVLRTVEKLRKKPPPPVKKKKDKSLDEQLLAAVRRHQRSPERAQQAPLGQRMTNSELDAVRRQIERCWVFPAGAKDPEDLIVEIKLVLNQDGTVRRAEIVDKFRIQLDPFYRAAAESALRAVLNPRCSPLKLPPEKYNEWKSMTLGFNPRDLVGR